MSEDRIRASDAERDDAIEYLRDAAGAGCLTLEELADRIETAGRATTRGELDTVTADLSVRPPPAAAAPTHSIGVFGDLRRSGLAGPGAKPLDDGLRRRRPRPA